MTTPKPDYKTLMQKALSEIKDLRAQLQQEQNKDKESIAIIGMGCRFPGGANTPEAFWELLVNGVDALTEVPSDRWNLEDYYDANPATPGKMQVRYGGFVGGLKEFDAEFFGISPREANSLDPQQRLLLEVTWEALERAGVIPHTEASKNTGVFVGISSSDYSQLLLERDPTEIDAYLATGNSHSTAAGRISYLLGFTAPSMAVDTACSSSLVAVHLACKSLRDRECNLAVTGGVHRLITPEFTINFSQARMLAPNGRCKTFDAAADGFTRGEGCGMVVLKRLTDAQKDGDNILAVIRGSAVNQDGRSSGLTVPNGVSQQTVIRQALANGGVEAKDISYIEAHGTGTALGDPIEITALGELFNRNNANPLFVGSVKTNIGHLEAAAGIASLIKVVLSLQHQQIPPHLHFNQPNPYIDWDNVGVKVVSQGKDWQQDRFRLAGVSSFGFSGTNAHVVVGDVDVSAKVDTETQRHGDTKKKLHLLTLSAKNEQALTELVKQYQKYLSSPAQLKDICYTASVNRSHFEHRLAIISQDIAELSDRLTAFNHNEETPGIYQSVSAEHNNKIAFLFTGQGSQYLDMGRELYETQPIFKENCDRCFQILELYLDAPIKEIIFSPSAPSALNKTQYTQPAIFTIEYALAQMWISWGIKPDVVMGHSIGEFVAATIAGVFSLEDAIKLVANRGKLMQELSSKGEMYVIQANEQQVNNLIKNISGKIAIAAINSPENTVISGETAAIAKSIAIFAQNKVKMTKLEVSHAFHSPLMESILTDFRKIAREVNYSLPNIPFISNITGAKNNDSIATGEYWVNHICQPVRFATGMKTLAELKCNIFLEIGAKPILLGMGRLCLTEYNALWLPSLRHGQSDWRSLLSSVASLYTNNINLDWANFYQNRGQIVSLPTYPFQRQEYWLSDNQKNSNVVGTFQNTSLLGKEIKLAKSHSKIWQNQITQDSPNYLADHQVGKQIIFPSAGYIEMALSAGKQVFNSVYLELSNIDFLQPLILSDLATEIQLVLDVDTDNHSSKFEIFSLDNTNWISNCQGKVTTASMINNNSNLTKYKQEIDRQINLEKYYQDLAQRGLEYGDSFRAITELYNSSDRALGKIELSDNLRQNTSKYTIHPVILDACLQVAGAAINARDNSETYLPIAIESFTIKLDRIPRNIIWSYVRVISENNGIYTLNVELISEQQESIAIISGLKIKSTSSKIINKTHKNLEDWLYQIEWRDFPLPNVIDNSFISLTKIKKAAVHKFEDLTSKLEFRDYLQLLAKLENLSVDYIVDALEKLGVSFNSEQLLSPSIEQLAIDEQYQSLWERILEILTEAAILEEHNNIWQVVKVPQKNNTNEQYQQLIQQYPIAKAELNLLHRCASQLDKVLSGNIAPKELLFPHGDLSLTNNLYQDSPGAKVTNTLVAEAIKQALVDKPQHKIIKILEIGAGTGGTTAYVLPELNYKNIEYTFSDLSPLFLTKAKEKFKEYEFVNYKLLDISQPSQNKENYDIIIAANVIHATADLKQTLTNIRQLLKPQGILILVEGTQPSRWFDLTFGMTEGWWKFIDKNLRASYPLISLEKWKQILLDTDFESVINLCNNAERGSHELSLQQAVIIAQANKKPTHHKHYLIFTDKQGIGKEISKYLAKFNYNYTLVTTSSEYNQENNYQINSLNPDEYDRLFKDLQQQGKKHHSIIYLQGLDSDRANLESNITNNANTVLYLTQTLIKNNITPTNLYLVTRGVVNLKREITTEGLSQSPLHGLTKVINLEYPEINCNCIDLDPQVNIQQQIEHLISEIQITSQAEQILWRNNTRKVARLTRSRSRFLALPKNKPYQLSLVKKGTPENLQLIPFQPHKPKANEVTIKVITTGLNFIDVLDTLGLLPFAKDWFGVECAGEIVEIGKEVTNFTVGDKVIALATGSFNQYITVDRLMVVAKPDNLNWEEAVTIPANFLTAAYAFNQVRSQESEVRNYNHQPVRILIHAAAGGTGMAAVQLAQLAGMEIFATASPNKWEFLHSLGIKQVMNSRNLEFADKIMQLTNGEGVDIIFNSLSGEFIERSLSILKENGHFLEIGKRHIKSKAEIAKIKPNISYSLIDLLTTAQQQPDLIQSLLIKLVTRFSTGELKPLPYKTFSLKETINAFQYMQQAKHIGKVVVQHENPVGATGESLLQIYDARSYLIAGGLGDLGLLTANWLVKKGAKYLILMGRNKPSEYAQQQINKLQQQGVTVNVIQIDITDYDTLKQIFISHNLISSPASSASSAQFPPLAGVIHSAGVLDDGMLINMDSERMKTVMNPKVLGAWNLHQLTKYIELDLFILFSSAASLLGSLGQTNHVVANTFLDGLAHYRKAQGLPGLSLNWGAWSDIGAAAKRKVDRQMNLKGIGSISPTEGLEILEKLMTQSNSQVGIVPIDWSQFITAGYDLPLVADFKQAKQENNDNNNYTSDFLAEIETIKPEHQLNFLTSFLQKEVAKILGLSREQLPSVSQGFFDIGMDSLMAIELKSKLETSLRTTIPSTAIFEYSNIEKLADYIFGEILNLEQPKTEPTETLETELSPEELKKAIAQELTDLESLL